MKLTSSPLLYLSVGVLWLISATIFAIENPIFVGPVYWPPIILGVAGVGSCVYALILTLKNRR